MDDEIVAPDLASARVALKSVGLSVFSLVSAAGAVAGSLVAQRLAPGDGMGLFFCGLAVSLAAAIAASYVAGPAVKTRMGHLAERLSILAGIVPLVVGVAAAFLSCGIGSWTGFL